MTGLPRIGSGLDVHPFATADRPLVLGGVEVDAAAGLDGHSDADVVTHAVIDAVLGAMSWGDIGSYFGTDIPELEGARSLDLLETLMADVSAAGWSLGNADVTIVAQTPRLAVHRESIRHSLARALAARSDEISVKATTTDHLGAIGRSEGIACWTVVLLGQG